MIVVLDGLGGSGKSSLAKALAQRLDAATIPLDHFTRPGTATWEHERFIDEVLAPLRAQEDARYTPWRYDWDAPAATVVVPAGAPLVVEGVSAMTSAVVERVGRWWDVSIWLETPKQVRRARIIRRDGQQLLPRWERDWWPSEETYFATERPDLRADIVLTAPCQ